MEGEEREGGGGEENREREESVKVGESEIK